MAKCIQNKNTGEITRVSDDEASKFTKAGSHSYASKSDWRRQRDGQGNDQRVRDKV